MKGTSSLMFAKSVLEQRISPIIVKTDHIGYNLLQGLLRLDKSFAAGPAPPFKSVKGLRIHDRYAFQFVDSKHLQDCNIRTLLVLCNHESCRGGSFRSDINRPWTATLHPLAVSLYIAIITLGSSFYFTVTNNYTVQMVFCSDCI